MAQVLIDENKVLPVSFKLVIAFAVTLIGCTAFVLVRFAVIDLNLVQHSVDIAQIKQRQEDFQKEITTKIDAMNSTVIRIAEHFNIEVAHKDASLPSMIGIEPYNK